MTPHLLLVDIGNTRSTVGCCPLEDGANPRIQLLGAIPGKASPGQEPQKSQLEAWLKEASIKAAMIASVVPEQTVAWCEILRGFGIDTQVLSHDLNLGIDIEYPNPSTIGPDRLANAVGAAFRYGTPVAVADFGTALTFDVVSRDSTYVGGMICPGLPLMFDYLAEKTALLPVSKPDRVPEKIGRSTEEAMQLGAWLGYRGMIREVFMHLRKEFGEDLEFVGTGGYHEWVLNGFEPTVRSDRDLTLFGLAKIYALNRNQA